MFWKKIRFQQSWQKTFLLYNCVYSQYCFVSCIQFHAYVKWYVFLWPLLPSYPPVQYYISQGALIREPQSRLINNTWHLFSSQSNLTGPVIGINVCKEASGGKNTDILVPHPTDCTKFFNCQSIKKYGNNWTWIAHEQNCPPTTGFDTSLKICNFIEQLPRCQRLWN